MNFDAANLAGLHPSKWVCVGAGYSREEIKAQLLNQGLSFTGHAVTSLADLARKIISVAGKTISRDQILTPLSRQEVLRSLLGDRRIISRFPELKRLKRQRSFFKKLDWAIQAGRLAFSHIEEEEVFSERLEQKLGSNPVRYEVKVVAHAYETWMLTKGLWDLPMLLRAAKEEMQTQELQEVFPKEILYYTTVTPESLEKTFWEEIKRRTLVTEIKPETIQNSKAAIWERWHTLDDAADRLAQALSQSQDRSDSAILIAEDPATRRTLARALQHYGVPLADQRDPTRMKWDETLKWALLPLEMVARNFERQQVVSWLRSERVETFSDWVTEINQRGIRFGLAAYDGGKLVELHAILRGLQEKLGQRLCCGELASRHIEYLNEKSKILSLEQRWILPFIDKMWKSLLQDMRRLDLAQKKAPTLFWFERFSYRALESQIYEKMKPLNGVDVYRFQQGNLKQPKKIWILGLPSQWLDSRSAGDYWFSEREREILASEFSVRSSIQSQEDHLKALQSWIHSAEEVTILDAQYSFDGKERESILPLLEKLKLQVSGDPIEKGAFERWKKSYSAFRPVPPQSVQLNVLGHMPQITAVEIDRYSRCSFQALALNRWKLWDVREPDTELWPEVRGNILHEAVRLLLSERISISEALGRAWERKRPKGLLQGKRIENYVKSKMFRVLEGFLEKEKDYLERSGAKIHSLDDREVKLEHPQFSVIGKPDRIDETADGFFVMDYKTTSDLPNGTEMLEQGYRLQLPFYAVAVEKNLKKRVLGVQFIELNKRGNRNQGVFFKKYNGKENGKFTSLRANSKSLLDSEPETVWPQFEKMIVEQSLKYVSGFFEALPKFEEECQQCPAMDLCGLRRKS